MIKLLKYCDLCQFLLYKQKKIGKVHIRIVAIKGTECSSKNGERKCAHFGKTAKKINTVNKIGKTFSIDYFKMKYLSRMGSVFLRENISS